MNRFTKDIGNMDDQVPHLMFDPIWVTIYTPCMYKFTIVFILIIFFLDWIEHLGGRCHDCDR